MSFLRLEDLFIAIIFAMAVAITGWAAIDADDASPLVSSATVVMERGTTADELEPALAGPVNEIQVAAHVQVCPCCAGVIAHTKVSGARTVLPPRPIFLN